MSEEKIVPVLNGAAETMLQSFYARAMYSKNPKHKFKDEKAEEIVKNWIMIFQSRQGRSHERRRCGKNGGIG